MPEGQLTGGDLVVETLVALGFDVVFGLPGIQLDTVFDALARRTDKLHMYHTRHEQASAYMADGYARSTGRPGCCLVVPGPGVLNTTAALATAYACNSPVLCVAGQVPTRTIGAGLGQLHEIPNSLAALSAVTKWSGRVAATGEIANVLVTAFETMLSGRPRPVAVEIPVDVLESVGEQTPKIEVLVSAKRPNRGDLDKAIGLLNKAEHPIIVSGGGVLRAGGWQQLQALAERLRAPVVMSTHGQGALSSEHPLAFSSLAGEKLIPEADVILAVGTRFALTYGSRRPVKPEQVLVSINIDPEEFVRGPKASVAIEADATQALASISESVHQRDSSEWRNLDRVRAEVRGLVGEMQPQAAYGAAIRDALPDDAIVVSGMTQVGYWCRVGYPVRQPRTMLSSGYQGTLGFEYPTGLGAQVGRPDTRVVVIAGDGGFLFGVQELATAAQHNIPAICIVFNDQAYGSVKRIQQRRFGRLISSELRNPDFVLLGESFGVKSVRATGPQELGLALKQALSYCGPVLIEVPTGEMDDPVPLTRRA